jgi:hypothetical protein
MSQENMNQVKELPVPALSAAQVEQIIKYANEKLPTMYGSYIINYIQSIAVELDRASTPEVVAEMPQS